MPENLNELIDEAERLTVAEIVATVRFKIEQSRGLFWSATPSAKCEAFDTLCLSLVELLGSYERLRTALESSIAERDKLAAELATTKADLANERAVRAVQAGKLAQIQALCNSEPTGRFVGGLARDVMRIIERGA